jgi:hypothetical protein
MSSLARSAPRNALCPCGSGRRYKHCCGAALAAETTPAPGTSGESTADSPVPSYVGWDSLTAGERQELWQMMTDALAAQRKFRYDLAGPLYEAVLERAPLTFDAVHMLGVVRIMEGHYEAAVTLLKRARSLAPGDVSVVQNLGMLEQRQKERRALQSASVVVARDMLRLFGASRATAFTSDDLFAPPAPDAGGKFHIAIPGNAISAGANATGVALARRMATAGVLWSGPGGDAAITAACGARVLGEDRAMRPSGGKLALFGLDQRALKWLPAAAPSFDSIVVGLDAHDPVSCVELLGRLAPEVVARVRFVARSAAVLEDFGLAGDVDPMLFDEPQRRKRPLQPARLPRIGVFIPAVRGYQDAARWNMLEWLREQPAFLRVLYAGRLPSPHLANTDEHLIGLATQWTGWADSLDALFYWGAEGSMRQYDRLVFEAAAADLPVVADGFGDFGALLAARGDCAQFFDLASAKSAMESLVLRDRAANVAEIAS